MSAYAMSAALPLAPGCCRRAGENTAEFMERRGWRVVDAGGCLWHSVERGFFMSLPYHHAVTPDPAAVGRMLVSQRALGVRFFTLSQSGLASGLYVCRLKQYDLSSIHQKQRSLVRRGMEKFAVRQVEESELLRQGLDLNRQTMKRQGRYDPEFGDARRWKRLAQAVYRSPGVAAYGAFSEGRLAAYLIACRDDNWLHLLHQMSRLEDLPNNPNHALTYAVTKMSAEDPTLEAVSYGVLSLIRQDGLHLYKLRFGYEVVERTSAFLIHPALSLVLASGVAQRAVRFLRRIRPHDQRIEKAQAVIEGAKLYVANRLG
ncbi:MAG TPA: hypothetical protein VLH09_06625 [Bryobacteraceae bacterium]|nr:hypothetical protein [Bryobacteraceae bacterium]